ncbi:response regulator [Modestobacter marinus]|uniref:response regulator n=1 Tax=Modestobacter marinus TaxID=477641 RepID=UPI00201B2B02|nr:response regulator transcription factor [Modestobacter marinus]
MTGLRLLLVDDDVLVRSGLRVILESEPGLTVVGDAGTGREALAVAADTDPDVVLMDVRMPDMDGIAATAELVARDPQRPRGLVLTTFEDDDYLFRSLQAGASGFALKRSDPDALVDAIRVVARGTSLVLPDLTRRLIATHAPSRVRGPAALPELTGREADVLRLVTGGLSNAEIATELFLSRETVKTHVSSVLLKLGARDRTQAVIAAYESGFLTG